MIKRTKVHHWLCRKMVLHGKQEYCTSQNKGILYITEIRNIVHHRKQEYCTSLKSGILYITEKKEFCTTQKTGILYNTEIRNIVHHWYAEECKWALCCCTKNWCMSASNGDLSEKTLSWRPPFIVQSPVPWLRSRRASNHGCVAWGSRRSCRYPSWACLYLDTWSRRSKCIGCCYWGDHLPLWYINNHLLSWGPCDRHLCREPIQSAWLNLKIRFRKYVLTDWVLEGNWTQNLVSHVEDTWTADY